MAKTVVGTIIEKAYRPPPGAPSKYWCYVMVETESGERVNVRLHQSVHDQVTTGDRVRLEKPRRENKRVKKIERL